MLNGLPAGVPPGHPATAASGAVPNTGGVASVNSAIQNIAQRYCGDCKVSLDAIGIAVVGIVLLETIEVAVMVASLKKAHSIDELSF